MVPGLADCCCVKLTGIDSFAAVNQWGLLVKLKGIIWGVFSHFVSSWRSLVSGSLSWELQAGARQLGAQVALKPASPPIQLLGAEEPGK